MFFIHDQNRCSLGNAFHTGGSMSGSSSVNVMMNLSKCEQATCRGIYETYGNLNMNSGSIHNSSLASRQFVKTSIYHTSWTHHIYTYVDNIGSIDHCALWCRIEPHYCELFYLEGTRCWYGYRNRVTYTGGPKGPSPLDVYWDPGKFKSAC